MASNIISVSATGLNEILASLIAMQNAMKGVTQAAKVMQNQINQGANPSGGGSAGNAGGNAGAAERARREANTSSQALRDNARRESMAFVAAYAEIASSVFALTAAFNALKSAAQFGVMLTAQDNFTRATGTNLQSIAKVMQQTTRYALDFQQAAQFSSIGKLAGFSTAQIKKLAETGTSAATILGRDVPEALSRMFRGVAKGEPEILDELGIFIRLDNAYKEYIKTVAKGQKVLDLSAYQRRQATYYAAIASGKQMAEGNANAKIDDFTTASAQLTTAVKTAMVSLTNVLGPVVKFLSENTALMVATVALVAGKLLSNLGNILFNVTAAKTALAAVQARRAENLASIPTNAATARDNFNRLSSAREIARLNSISESASIRATNQKIAAIDAYKKATLTQLAVDKRAGLVSDERAKKIRKAVAAMDYGDKTLARAQAGVKSFANDGVGKSTQATRDTKLLASNANVALLGAQTAATNAAAAATARLSINMASTRVIGGAAFGYLTAQVNRFSLAVAELKASMLLLGTQGMLGSLASAASILFMAFVGGKAVLSFFGALGKGVSDANDTLKSSSEQIDKIMVAYNKLGKKDPLTDTEGLNNAKIYNNVLDSTSAELDTILIKLRDMKEAEDAYITGANFGKVETALAQKVVYNSTKLLDTEGIDKAISQAKASFENLKVLELLKQGRSVDSNGIADSVGTKLLIAQLNSESYNATKNAEAFITALSEGKIPAGVLKAYMAEVNNQLEAASTKAASWSGALEGVANSISLLQKEFGALSATLIDESVYSGMLNKAQSTYREVKQLAEEFKKLNSIPITKANNAVMVSKLQSAKIVMETINTSLGLPTITVDSDTTANAISVMGMALDATADSAKIFKDRIEAIRKEDINSTDVLTQNNKLLDKNNSLIKSKGINISALTVAAQAYNSENSKILALERKIKTVEYNRPLGDSNDSNIGLALTDARDRVKILKNALADSAANALSELETLDIGKTSLKLPIVITPEVEIETRKLTTDMLIAMGKTKEEAEKLATKLIIDQKVSFEVSNTTKPLSDSLDLLKEMQAVTIKTYPQSLLDRVSNYETILYNSGQLSLVLAKELNDKKKYYVKLLDEELTAIRNNNSAYSLSLNLQQIVNSELLNTTIASNTLASTLSNVFSGLNVDLAEKIASMESKLQEAAIAHAKTATEAVLVNLSNKDVSIDSAKTTDEKQFLNYTKAIGEAYNEGAPGLEKLANLEKSRNILREKIINDNSILAIQEAKKIHLTQEQIKVEEKLIKENKCSTMMIESAKQVTSAWEDAKMAIAKGMGADGKSLADQLKDSLSKGSAGILDMITNRIGKKQELAFDTLQNKAKDYFLGSKDDKGNKLPGALDRIGESFKGFRNDMTTKFPKTIGTLSKGFSSIGGLEALKGIFAKDETQRNAAIGGALGSVAGTAIGTAFTAIGGPLGGAIGSVVGNIIGNTFGKKLKETGFEVTVSKTGEVFANELQVFKKTTLTGTKTINNIIGKLDSESAIALQQAINGTRDTYVSSLLQYNKLTAGAFNLSLDKFRNFSYSGRFVQQAGGNKDSNELLKNFVTDYGNKMGEADFSFLYQFRMATESIVDVLKRLVATIRTTETAFHTMFGNTFKGPAITAKEYISSYASDTDNYEGIGKDVNNSITAYDAAHREVKRKSRIKKIVGGAIGLASGGLLSPGTILGAIGASTSLGTASILGAVGTKALGSPQTNGDKGVTAGNALSTGIADIQALLAGGKASHTELVLQGLQDFIAKNAGIIKISEDSKAKLDTLALMEKALKDTTDTASMEKVLQIARADYYSNMVAAFDGANAAEKEANYNKALSTYTGVVAAGVTGFSNSYSGMVDSLSAIDTEKLPDNISAVRNNLILPIQEYNKALQLAVETEASPTKIAEAIKLGAKLAEVIQSILDVFSSINISEANNAASFSASVVSGIGDTFKQSVMENFKKSLLAPLLADAVAAIGTADSSSNITYKSSLDAAGYALGGDIAVKSAKDMLSVLSDKGFTDSLASVSVQFERLISTFDKLDTSKAIVALDKALVDIAKTLKESAYSFAVTGDSYSVSIFKAREAFKAAGLSSELASEPISSVVAKMKAMASSGSLTTKSLDSINEALNAMADVSIAARDQIQATVEASQSSINSAEAFISSLTKSIIDDSGSIEAAKSSLTSLLDIASSKVDKARLDYAKARASGNLLLANQAAENLTSTLDSYVNQQIDANNTLKGMAEDRYNAEKTALDNVKTIISDIANFVKDLKFDDKLSILKPIDRLTEAASNFDNLRAKVLLDSANGQLTPEAIKTLQDESKRLLDLGRDVYSSGAAYTDLYSKVMSAMATVDSRAQADVITKEASTKLYQDMALAYAKDNRDIQVDALSQLKILTKASAVDNAIAVDMINALKYNQGLPQSVTLNDYYKQLFSDAQGGGTIFTQPNIGYQDFNNVGTYDEANKVAQEATNAKLNLVLETLTTVLQNLPVNVKSAIQSSTTPTVNRN